MHVLKYKVLEIACLCLLVFACQVSKNKSVVLEKTDLTFVTYGPDTCYARTILVHDNVIYTANSNGYIYRYDLKLKVASSWNKTAFPELRDLHLIDAQHAIASQAADTSVLLQLNNEKETALSLQSGPLFLDAMDINSAGFGLLMGDPVAGVMQLFTTQNHGLTWKAVDPGVPAMDGEAGFAASGSIVQVLNDSTYLWVSGGKTSRLFRSTNFGRSWTSNPIPFKSSEASGAFSVHFWNEMDGIVVGGDYLEPEDTSANCFLTRDGGLTWEKPYKAPLGYRCHVILEGKKLYACGTNGVDYSTDYGRTWVHLFDQRGFALTSFKGRIYCTTKNGQFFHFKAL